jgi:hypothetical protein
MSKRYDLPPEAPPGDDLPTQDVLDEAAAGAQSAAAQRGAVEFAYNIISLDQQVRVLPHLSVLERQRSVLPASPELAFLVGEWGHQLNQAVSEWLARSRPASVAQAFLYGVFDRIATIGIGTVSGALQSTLDLPTTLTRAPTTLTRTINAKVQAVRERVAKGEGLADAWFNTLDPIPPLLEAVGSIRSTFDEAMRGLGLAILFADVDPQRAQETARQAGRLSVDAGENALTATLAAHGAAAGASNFAALASGSLKRLRSALSGTRAGGTPPAGVPPGGKPPPGHLTGRVYRNGAPPGPVTPVLVRPHPTSLDPPLTVVR